MRVRKDRYFDLEGLPSEEVRKLLEDFVWERGKKLAPSSLASEILYFNNIRNFLIEKNIKILRYEDENKIILQLKSWMMEKGYALTSKKYRSVYEIVATETPGIIKHMKKILRYSQKDGGCLEQERDVWELDKFEFPLRSNPIKNVKTINFKGISQITIRKEVKTVIFMHLKYMAIGSIMAEMVATKRFCRYLALRYPKIISLLDLTRDIMESYLIYLQTEAKERKNYRSDLYGLRRVIEDVGNHYDRQDIELAGLKLTATDINGKQSVTSYDIHVGYYYYTVLMSLDGAPNHGDSTPGCFFSASAARAFDYCDGKDNWQEVDIAFSSYSSNTVIRAASLKQSITKFKHATCGLDKWDNVKGVYFRTASNIKRSGFDKATINDMKAERLATGFAEVALLTEGNFETATEAVGVYETPINGVAKRVIVTYDHFVERTTQNLAASKFMIKVKIEK